MLTRRHRVTACAAIAAIGCGCGSSGSDEPDGDVPRAVVAIIDHDGARDLDLLFVIDGANSFIEQQFLLAEGFDELVAELAGSGALPDLHLGVASMDVGAGDFNIAACDGPGDDGVLQNAPRIDGCAPPSGQFIVDVAAGDGTRTTNYAGALPDAFACISRLGINDCAFEQPLESMRRALDGRNAQNAGFLRDGAWLAIVFATNEDDCSASDTTLFDTSQAELDSPLGPLSSFRCFEFGVECNERELRGPGPRTGCHPREDSPYLFSVSEYVQVARSLRADPSRVFVAGIVAPPEPVFVQLTEDGFPDIGSPCLPGPGGYDPAVRLNGFFGAFPARHHTSQVCNRDYADQLASLGRRLRDVMTGSACLDAAIALPADCTVHDVTAYGTPAEASAALPACDDPGDPEASSNQPCFAVVADPAGCGDRVSDLAVRITPADRIVPAGTRTVVACASD